MALQVAHQRPLPLVQQHQQALKNTNTVSLIYNHLVGGRQYNVRGIIWENVAEK